MSCLSLSQMATDIVLNLWYHRICHGFFVRYESKDECWWFFFSFSLIKCGLLFVLSFTFLFILFAGCCLFCVFWLHLLYIRFFLKLLSPCTSPKLNTALSAILIYLCISFNEIEVYHSVIFCIISMC